MAMDDHFWDEEVGGSRKRGRKEKEPRPPREPRIKGERKRHVSDRESILNRYKVMQVRLQDRNGNFFTVKKKISTMDPSLPTYVRIPPVPIPRSWIHPIKPAEDTTVEIPGSRYGCVEDKKNREGTLNDCLMHGSVLIDTRKQTMCWMWT